MVSTIWLRRDSGGPEVNFRPGFPSGRGSSRDAVILPGNPALAQRRERNERNLLSWEFRWTEAPEGQRFLLERAWEKAVGPVLVMKYTEPGDVDANAFDVSFAEDSLQIERAGLVKYNMAIVVEEVI